MDAQQQNHLHYEQYKTKKTKFYSGTSRLLRTAKMNKYNFISLALYN